MGIVIQEQQEIYNFFKFAFRVSYTTLSKSWWCLKSYIQQHVLNFAKSKKNVLMLHGS